MPSLFVSASCALLLGGVAVLAAPLPVPALGETANHCEIQWFHDRFAVCDPAKRSVLPPLLGDGVLGTLPAVESLLGDGVSEMPTMLERAARPVVAAVEKRQENSFPVVLAAPSSPASPLETSQVLPLSRRYRHPVSEFGPAVDYVLPADRLPEIPTTLKKDDPHHGAGGGKRQALPFPSAAPAVLAASPASEPLETSQLLSRRGWHPWQDFEDYLVATGHGTKDPVTGNHDIDWMRRRSLPLVPSSDGTKERRGAGCTFFCDLKNWWAHHQREEDPDCAENYGTGWNYFWHCA